MAFGLKYIIPGLLTLSSLVLTGVLLSSNSTGNGPASELYFLKLDTKAVGDTINNLTATDPTNSYIGKYVPDYYTVGMWGFCFEHDGVNDMICSGPTAAYSFNFTKMILKTSGNPASASAFHLNSTLIHEDASLSAVYPKNQTLVSVAFTFYILSAVAIALAMFIGFLVGMSHKAAYAAAAWSFVAFLSSLIGSATTVTAYRRLFNALKTAKVNGMSVPTTWNNAPFALSWAATITALLALNWWLVASYFASRQRAVRSEERFYERQSLSKESFESV